MTPLRQAATDYLALRRALGFKLRANEDALIEFKADALMKDALGDSLYETFVTSREAEIKEYRTRVTDWEVMRYLETI